MRVATFFLWFFCVLTIANGASARTFSARVVGISDGDTIKVLKGKKAIKIRLDGIDCPEKRQAYGSRAKQFTAALAFGKTVRVNTSHQDRYERELGEIFLPDGQSLNRELLKSGMAWWYRQYSKDDSLGALEEAAKTAKIGLWADPHPIPPWEFRHPRKTKKSGRSHE